MRNNVFSANYSGVIAPGASNFWQTRVTQNTREFKIKSLHWDLLIRYNAWLSGNIPLSQVNTVNYYLMLGSSAVPGVPLYGIMDRPAVPAGGAINDYGPVLTKPGQLFFDSFFVSNSLPLDFDIENYDALKTVYYRILILIEIEQL